MSEEVTSGEQRPRILLLDQDSDFLAHAEKAFRSHPGAFEVVACRTQGEAIEEIVRNGTFSAALIEVRHPRLEGMELIHRLRQSHPSMPVAVLTSEKDFRLVVEAIRQSVDDFVAKSDTGGAGLPGAVERLIERERLKARVEERLKADTIARKRADAIRELIVTICHEFNNPLAAIKISADIMRRQPLTGEQMDLVMRLDAQIHRVEAEINKLRSASREDVPEGGSA